MTRRNITYINPKDPVSASVTNKPLQELKRETDALQAKIETVDAGNAIIYKSIPCDSSVKVGMPVYWDNTNQCCKPAYVSSELSSLTGEYVTGTPADCIGLAYNKDSAQAVDILISGLVELPEVQTYLKGDSGRFYLGNQAGTLTCTPCSHAFPLGVAIGALGPCDRTYKVYFNPSYTNSLLQHQHFSIELAPVRDTAEERAIPGWSSYSQQYDDDAPTDSVYLYNLEAHEELNKLWPPIPMYAVSVMVEWVSDETVGAKEITVNEADSLIRVTQDGIYWMSSTYLPFTTPTSDGCTNAKKVTLNFSKIRYANRMDFVTSLQPDTNQPFKFVDCKGQEANSGDLYAQFTLKDNPVISEDHDGWAVKKFRDDWKTEKVAVVNALKVNGNASVTGTHQLEDGYYAGELNLVISPFAGDTEISPQIVKVGAAQEREIYDVTYLGLPSGRNSSLRLKFEIPSNYVASDVDCTFKLRMQCIAPISGQYPSVSTSLIRIPRANTEAIPITNIVQQELTWTMPSSVTEGTIFEVESTSTTIKAGDTIIVIISRSSTSGYSADMAIARIHGVINVA